MLNADNEEEKKKIVIMNILSNVTFNIPEKVRSNPIVNFDDVEFWDDDDNYYSFQINKGEFFQNENTRSRILKFNENEMIGKLLNYQKSNLVFDQGNNETFLAMPWLIRDFLLYVEDKGLADYTDDNKYRQLTRFNFSIDPGKKVFSLGFVNNDFDFVDLLAYNIESLTKYKRPVDGGKRIRSKTKRCRNKRRVIKKTTVRRYIKKIKITKNTRYRRNNIYRKTR